MQAKLSFLLKFLFVAGFLLPLWLSKIAQPYLGVLGHESALVLQGIGFKIYGTSASKTHVDFDYSPTQSLSFEAVLITLNMIVYISLLAASPGLGWRRRGGFLLLGMLILNLFQVLYLTMHFYVAWHYGQNSQAASILASVSEIAYLLLPVLLWIAFEAPRLFKRQNSLS